eukprot:342575_1
MQHRAVDYICTICMLYVLQVTISTASKSVFLTRRSSNLSNVSVTTGSSVFVQEIGHVDKSGDWNISVVSQYGADLTISMHNDWGFDPIHPSTINIQLNGITPSNALHTDLLLIFSVNNDRYLGCSIRLDATQSYGYKIYPNSNHSLATTDVFNMIHSARPTRWTRYSAFNQWSSSLPIYKKAAIWPLYFSITNDPISNTVIYKWRDAANTEFVVNTLYTTSFATEKGMTVYLSGDDLTETFVIQSINITKQTGWNTPSPTIQHASSSATELIQVQTSNAMGAAVTDIRFEIAQEEEEGINKMHVEYSVMGLVFVMCLIAFYMIYITRKGNKYDKLPSEVKKQTEPNTAVTIGLTRLVVVDDTQMSMDEDTECGSEDMDIDTENMTQSAQTILSSGATMGSERSLSDSPPMGSMECEYYRCKY